MLAGKEPDPLADCGDSVALPPAQACTVGRPDAPKLALVVGDSTARAYMPTLQRVADLATGWRLRYVGMSGCTFVDARIDHPLEWIADACPARKEAAVDVVAQEAPDLVIVTNNLGPQIDGDTGDMMPVGDWAAALERYAAMLRPHTGQLAFLASPPAEVEVQECYTRLSTPVDCITRITPTRTEYEAAVAAVAQRQAAHYVESSPWFCAADLCPAFVGSTATKKDVVHVTAGYGGVIAPAVLESFRAQGLLQ